MLSLRLALVVVVLGTVFSYCCHAATEETQLDIDNFPESERNEPYHPLQTVKNGLNYFKERIKNAYRTAKGKLRDFKNKVKSYLTGSGHHKYSNMTTTTTSNTTTSRSPPATETDYAETVANVEPVNATKMTLEYGAEPAIIGQDVEYDPSTDAAILPAHNWTPSSEPPLPFAKKSSSARPVSASPEDPFMEEIKPLANKEEVEVIQSYMTRIAADEVKTSSKGRQRV